MIIKFFKSGQGTVDYQLKNLSSIVLRGDSEITKSLIKSLTFKQKWCGGAISISEKIEREVITKIIEEFEETMRGGIAHDRVNFLWIMHTDKGRTELHFTIPQIDLGTGKEVSWYVDMRDRKLFEAFRDKIDYEHGFSSPQKNRLPMKNSRHLTDDKKQIKEEIDRQVAEKVSSGMIRNRNELVAFLFSFPGLRISRLGKNYISVHMQNGIKIRFRGEIYEENFERKNLANRGILPGFGAVPKTILYSELQENYQKQLLKRKELFSVRYRKNIETKVENSPDQERQPPEGRRMRIFRWLMERYENKRRKHHEERDIGKLPTAAEGIFGFLRENAGRIGESIERIGKLFESAFERRGRKPEAGKGFVNKIAGIVAQLGRVKRNCTYAGEAVRRTLEGIRGFRKSTGKRSAVTGNSFVGQKRYEELATRYAELVKMQNDLSRESHHISNKYLYALKIPKVFRNINTILYRWHYAIRKEKLRKFYVLKGIYLSELENYEFTRLAVRKLNCKQKGMYFDLLDRCREMSKNHLPCCQEQLLIQRLKNLLKSKDAGHEAFQEFFERLNTFMRMGSVSQARSNAYLQRNHAASQSIRISM